ncbi:MAG TPA: DNA repair ATPase [Thermoanaerobaculia bacterium]|nr:DNA repair ATPase [Thermoanaerobaculia bacterium]
MTGPSVDRGTYEIVRDRLLAQARQLGDKAEGLNARRLELFGGGEMAILGSERIRTEHNCVPRDIAVCGDRLLFGYNVFFGLKSTTAVTDVFSLHRFEERAGGFTFTSVSPGTAPGLARDYFLDDPRLVHDFHELYRYYKDARLLQLRRTEGKLLAVFQTGASVHDLRVLRWAVDPDGNVTYIDNRGERDHVFPPAHDFEWTPTTREDHRRGRHPHVSILDEVFVETVGGDLTIKVEDNTGDGLGIWREPVLDADQSLDDAEIAYAKLGGPGGLILLRVRPYREPDWRYLVFNTLTRQVDRIDAIGQACVQLPEDHGIIFPGGYYLRSGERKVFDLPRQGLEYERVLRSPNGEDALYVFHERGEGRTVLLPYNLVRRQVQTPIQCHGYSLFPDGKMAVFRADSDEPSRVHALQVWQTPFSTPEHAASAPKTGSHLEKIGNADLVRGISDLLSLRRAIEEQSPSIRVYEDLIAAANRAVDAYHWLGSPEVGDLLGTLREILATAELIVGEFEKVEVLRREAAGAVTAAERDLASVVSSFRPDSWQEIDPFVTALRDLRAARGRLISLREHRYVDLGRLDELERETVRQSETLAASAVELLRTPAALAPYQKQLAVIESEIGQVATAAQAGPLGERIETLGAGLELLTEIVGGLPIEDATVRTAILESISEVLAQLNRVRALLAGHRKTLLDREGLAEFGAQFKLFAQSLAGALALAGTPEQCDAQLSRLMLQLEELESRFSEHEELLVQLADKREEVFEAFSARKQMLLDARQRRAQGMEQAAARILEGIRRRSQTFASDDEVNAFFASDPMAGKVRELVVKLRELGDIVRADEIEGRLKAARQEAGRALRDRRDLFEEGAAVIKLGRHRFSVNIQPLELTIVPRGDGMASGMAFHLTGTDFHEPVTDSDFEATRPYWDQTLASETPEVYRAEYLAATILADAEAGKNGLSLAALRQGDLLEWVRSYAAERYDEGYERGIHDHDAALILGKLLVLYPGAGLLRFGPRPRALAALFWSACADAAQRAAWELRARSLSRLRSACAPTSASGDLAGELSAAIGRFLEERRVPMEAPPEVLHLAGLYLVEELAESPVRFTTGPEAVALRKSLLVRLRESGQDRALAEDLKGLEDLGARYRLAHAWVEAHLGILEGQGGSLRPAVEETTVLLLTERGLDRRVLNVPVAARVEGLLGQHPRIAQRSMELRLDDFLARLEAFRRHRVPGFRDFQAKRHQILERERERLRVAEFQPRVMSAFVRNRLIDQVYLPLIGDNLAKQLGTVGEGRRTDLMGLLLLVSPPGYGKTTLMEYVANRLGLVFLKIDGPALGSTVRSLDPAEAPNATARQEVEKIGLALEMGNNVLLYLDDIQHTSAELLQKFISLCDAQRRVEGVWRGRTRTYDLRGKRFCVCMAGNPYTGSGERFQIPDMLANRADTFNLGDILAGKDDLFALSYLENALTSNPVLAPLASRDPEDVCKLVLRAKGEEVPSDQLSHAYSALELSEITAVFKQLLRIQQVLLEANRQYILSASQDDAFRTEPRFQLQGSYRNMNKLAAKVVPVMNGAELESLIDDHYAAEAQTLTQGAEHNLLKLAELRGRLSPQQSERWAAIKRSFARIQLLGASDGDPVSRVTGQLNLLSERVGDVARHIETAIRQDEGNGSAALAPPAEDGETVRQVTESLGQLAVRLDRIGEILQQAAADGNGNGSRNGNGAAPEVLERLDRTLATLAAAPRGVEVVQSLPGTVHDLLAQMVDAAGENLIPLLRGIGRRLKKSAELSGDAQLRDQMDRALKSFDQLKDLADALRKIDTRAHLSRSPGPEQKGRLT